MGCTGSSEAESWLIDCRCRGPADKWPRAGGQVLAGSAPALRIAPSRSESLRRSRSRVPACMYAAGRGGAGRLGSGAGGPAPPLRYTRGSRTHANATVCKNLCTPCTGGVWRDERLEMLAGGGGLSRRLQADSESHPEIRPAGAAGPLRGCRAAAGKAADSPVSAAAFRGPAEFTMAGTPAKPGPRSAAADALRLAQSRSDGERGERVRGGGRR